MADKYKINVTDYKILWTIKYLNELNYCPSSQGVLKILNGVLDEETEMFELCDTFQVLISYTSKRMTRDINRLLKHALIKRIYNEKEDDYFYVLTDLGIAVVNSFKAHHVINLKKHEAKKKKSFIKMM